MGSGHICRSNLCNQNPDEEVEAQSNMIMKDLCLNWRQKFSTFIVVRS
jgi:hypothetical protein